MNAMMTRCFAAALLVATSAAATRAQQNSQTNQSTSQGDQNGKQHAGSQQPGSQPNQANSQQAQVGKQQADSQQQGSQPNQENLQQAQVGKQQSAGANPANSQGQGVQQQGNHSYIIPWSGNPNGSNDAQWWKFPTFPGNFGSWVSGLNADINVTPADDALRAHLNLPKNQGLIVTGLAANTPVAQLGLEQNDVLLELAGVHLSKPEELESCLKSVGDQPVPLTFLRAGKPHKIQIQPIVRVTMGPVKPEPPVYWIGVSVSPLEPALRSQLKLQNRGLLVTEVIKDSPTAQIGVKVYDILLSLDGKPLDSQEKLVESVQSTGEKSVPLELIREGKTLKLSVAPSRRRADQVSVRDAFDFYYGVYEVARPGAVINGMIAPNTPAYRINPDGTWIADLNIANSGWTATGGSLGDQTKPADSSVSAKRIDELDAEIKQLRKAIEELSGILKEKK